VQFVSKAIEPPFRDGSKCLVRDLCLHLGDFDLHVLGTEQVPSELGPRAKVHAVYGGAGRYAPTLLANLRAFAWLLTSEPPDLFHFVFAPNPRTSAALRLLRAATGVPCLQTIASAPKVFSRPERLFVGDAIVAQSRHTKGRTEQAFVDAGLPPPLVHVIPPPAPTFATDPHERRATARTALGLAPEGPLFVYPGDLEVSGGAAFVLELARRAAGDLAAATFLIAYRCKTKLADLHREELERGAPPRVQFRAEVDDLHAVLAAATAVVFPVDDLYGKVDLPIVLLEALSLGVPVVVLDQGPLSELSGASHLPLDPGPWLELLGALSRDSGLSSELGARGPAAVRENYEAARVAACYAALYRRLLLPAVGC